MNDRAALFDSKIPPYCLSLAGRFLMLLTFLLWPPVIWGQILPGEEDPDALKQLAPSYDEAGAPFFFEHFEPQDYRHYPQNWSIVQDQRGIIYVANFDGLLEYDGNQWRFIETATNMVVRSLALGHDGRVYVGTNGDFGYLAPDSTNTLRYRPLIDQIDPEHRTFSDVWGTHATAEGIYFQTSKHLFRWDGKQMKVWQSQAGFHTSFVVRGQFYVREFGVGLLQVVNGQLQLAPGGEHFAELGLFMMVPHAEDGILIGTSKQGFFLYRQGVATPFVTQADSLLKDFPLYHGCALPGGFYALATLGGGGLIIDQQGALVRVLDKDAGMPDNWVNFVYADAQGGLWMALDAAGIVRLDVSSQLTLYDDRLNLHGIINALERYGHTLYVGTSTGLSRLHRPASAAKRRLPVLVDVLEGLPTTALIATDSILFVATHEGLYALRDGEPERLEGGTFFALL